MNESSDPFHTAPTEPAAAAAPATSEATTTEAPARARSRGGRGSQGGKGKNDGRALATQPSARKVNPVLERLFELYPQLFGARFVPLKLGVYQELLAAHGDELKAEDLKLAMSQHARSTRYLESVAAGHPRHDLQGSPVEPVAPEHVHHAIIELFRRRQQRTPDNDLRPQLVERLVQAIDASGLDREAYDARVRSTNEANNALLDEAFGAWGLRTAKREALLRAFEQSGKSEAEFAEMYGLEKAEVRRAVARKTAAG